MVFGLSTTVLTQHGMQAIGAGVLSGLVGGSALVATGAIPLGGTVRQPTVEALACPGTGPALATIGDGSPLLVTGRSSDGSWYEVYLGDRWYTFDATQEKPRGGRIVVAHGRDATDVAFISSYAPLEVVDMTVTVRS